MKIYRVHQALRRTSQHWARFLPQGWHGPPAISHTLPTVPRFTKGGEWQGERSGLVSLADNLFHWDTSSLLVTKATSFEATRDRKYLSQSEPKDASSLPTRESCVQKGLQPCLLPHFFQGTEGRVPGVSTSAHWYLWKERTRFLVLRIE